MARPPHGALLGGLHLDVAGGTRPLVVQLAEALRGAILEGSLTPGTRLPATRTLARELSVGRNTVVHAFEQLQDEGYLESRVGAGSFVARRLPERYLELAAKMRRARGGTPAPERPVRLSRRGAAIAALSLGSDPVDPTPFAPGLCALDLFPWGTWKKLVARHAERGDPALFGFGDPRGAPALREAIAEYLATARGVRARPDDVLVLGASQQALDLVARVVLDPGDAAWIEEPGYLGARAAFAGAGARLVPVPVDAAGLSVDHGRGAAPEARLVHVTPSHQYPLGMAMPLERRLELLAWVRESGSFVIEDDYDSEYRYRGRPIPALQGLDDTGHVIYVGTFTKVLFPGLRLAYLVAPPSLMPALVAARQQVDGHSPAFAQAVVHDFLREGHFAAHLRRMRLAYDERQGAVREALRAASAGSVSLERAVTGMHLVLDLEDGTDDGALSKAALGAGIDAPALSRYYLGPPQRRGLVLGYTGFPPSELRLAAERLADLLP